MVRTSTASLPQTSNTEPTVLYHAHDEQTRLQPPTAFDTPTIADAAPAPGKRCGLHSDYLPLTFCATEWIIAGTIRSAS